MRTLIALLAISAATPAFAQSSQPGVPAPEVARQQALNPDPDQPPAAPEGYRTVINQAGQPSAAEVANIRVNQLVIFEGDTCPPSTDETINVCAVLPSQDRFRIPQNLRSDPNAPENQAWTNRALELNFVGRTGIGSCSTVGPGGFTGCAQQLINQAVAERRGRPEVNWARLIEEARQERLGGINRAAAEAEAEAGGSRRIQQLQIQPGQLCPPSTEAVILSCTYPDGTPAPTQPAGEPQLPVAGARATPQPPVQAQPRPQR